tara:strand:- start:1360 stop:1980 length:621 start_codon:yes stop_codon:yes gene_type:complete
MLTFEEYIDNNKIAYRVAKQGYYDIDSVKKNFYKVLNVLGAFDKTEYIAALTLRLKNKVKVKKIVDGVETFEYIPTDYPVAKSVANAISIKLTRKFWGRKGRYNKMPMVFSIESSKNWDKEHIHALIRFTDLKQYYSPNELSMILRSLCYTFDEVNRRDHTAVEIRMFHYCENQTKELGSSIEYICKSSANFKDHSYNPLLDFTKN